VVNVEEIGRVVGGMEIQRDKLKMREKMERHEEKRKNWEREKMWNKRRQSKL
jgi:hypothetical protein